MPPLPISGNIHVVSPFLGPFLKVAFESPFLQFFNINGLDHGSPIFFGPRSTFWILILVEATRLIPLASLFQNNSKELFFGDFLADQRL